jgi:hypothetical protein
MGKMTTTILIRVERITGFLISHYERSHYLAFIAELIGKYPGWTTMIFGLLLAVLFVGADVAREWFARERTKSRVRRTARIRAAAAETVDADDPREPAGRKGRGGWHAQSNRQDPAHNHSPGRSRKAVRPPNHYSRASDLEDWQL